MMSSKERHETHVSGHSGSSMFDVIMAVYPLIPSTVISVLWAAALHSRLSFLVEFLIIVLPLVLSFTVLSDAALQLNVTLIVVALISLWHFRHSHIRADDKSSQQIGFLAIARSITNLATAVAILAVDFNVFPRRFAKTEKYGYSLMDIGAACFVIMNGITEGRKRENRRVLTDVAILLGLALCRLIVVSLTDYQHHVSEYGVHCNFFFTLAFLKLCFSWIFCHLKMKVCLCLGIIISILHECVLLRGLSAWTLSNLPRTSLIAANREWIVSLPGYVSLYFIGGALGIIIFSERKNTLDYLKTFLSITKVSLILVLILESNVEQASRRLANITFVAWTVFFFVFFLSNCATCESLVQMCSRTLYVPTIMSSASRHGLLFFILANVFTGIINLSVDTLSIHWPLDVVLIGSYVLFLVVTVHVASFLGKK